MKKILQILSILCFSLSLSYADKVKIFDLDLEHKILETSGKKVEKFKMDDLIVSTNMSLAENEEAYVSKNGYFSLTFPESQSNMTIYLDLYGQNAEWRLKDNMGESVYINQNGHNHSFVVAGKEYKYKRGSHFKIIIKNSTFTFYANNKKLFNLSLDTLKGGIKTIAISNISSINNYAIYK